MGDHENLLSAFPKPLLKTIKNPISVQIIMRLAIVRKESCFPDKCGNLCAKLCPVNRKGEDCITIGQKASISETLCIGCGICQNRCPFGAISIINLPGELDKRVVHRYGDNGFVLYNLPIPRFDAVLGLLGKNGIGKSTAVKILSNKMKPNLGKKEASEKEVHEFFKGSELLNYFKHLHKTTVAIKPQEILELQKYNGTVKDLIKKMGEKSSNDLVKQLGVDNLLDKSLDGLSGGELQKVAIAVASLKESDIYFFDEPLAYLDVGERIRVSDFIRERAGKEKAVMVIEHDLLLLDYMTDFVNIMYGKPSCYGVISSIRASKNAINSYLLGFLKEENVRFRDKPIKFNLGMQRKDTSYLLFEWPAFTKTFKGFSLDVPEGRVNSKSIIGIAGRNATGKTTFVKCLAGVLETDQKNIKSKMKISYKPQYIDKDSEVTVAEIIRKEKIDKRMMSLLSLETLMFRQLKQLSGGELQRVAIAACLAKDADIYLIDEPSAHLDVEERIQAARAIEERVKEENCSVFVADHDLLFLAYLADTLIIFSGEPSKHGMSSGPVDIKTGMNDFMKLLNITVRREEETGRPRINKHGSVIDREQREKNKWFMN